MGTIDLPPPSVGPLSRLAPKPIRFVLNWGRRYSLWVFNFGLACCAIEFIATSMSRHDFIRLGVIPFAPGPRQADLMVVSGTVSDKMAPAVRRLCELARRLAGADPDRARAELAEVVAMAEQPRPPPSRLPLAAVLAAPV
ncbi:hypothetical protein AB0C69_00500, partial [Actinomadura sp. NPDC048032]